MSRRNDQPDVAVILFGGRGLELIFPKDGEPETFPNHLRVLTQSITALFEAVKSAEIEGSCFESAMVGIECLSNLVGAIVERLPEVRDGR